MRLNLCMDKLFYQLVVYIKLITNFIFGGQLFLTVEKFLTTRARGDFFYNRWVKLLYNVAIFSQSMILALIFFYNRWIKLLHNETFFFTDHILHESVKFFLTESIDNGKVSTLLILQINSSILLKWKSDLTMK